MGNDEWLGEEIVCDDDVAPPEINAALCSWDARRMRLYLLRGMPCPLCRRAGRRPLPDLEWTGVSLACPQGHGWSNPDALRADFGLRRGPRGAG